MHTICMSLGCFRGSQRYSHAGEESYSCQ